MQYHRFVYDPAVIAAILDQCETVHLGFQDKRNAYVVPMCFGYAVTEEKLLIYIHTGKESYTLRLIDHNPIVCCCFSAWRNYPDRPYKGHYHDFRSVMAFGKIHLLDPKAETKALGGGLQALLRRYNRTGCKNPKGIPGTNFYVIECDWADVSGKTETPVRRPEDVPFVDVYSLPEDQEPYDESDLFLTRENKVRNRTYLGYLND